MRMLFKTFLTLLIMMGISFAHCGGKDCEHHHAEKAEHCMDGEKCEKCTSTCQDCAKGACEDCKTGSCEACKKAGHKGCHKAKHHKKNMTYVAKVGDLEITRAYMRPTAAISMPTAAYLAIKNTGDKDDALLRVTSDVASKNEIHTSDVDENGVMKMRKIDKLSLPAGKVTMLKPHGYHIMLVGTKQVLPKGASIPLLLDFENAGSKMVSFPVMSKAPHQGCSKHHHHHKDDHKHHKH